MSKRKQRQEMPEETLERAREQVSETEQPTPATPSSSSASASRRTERRANRASSPSGTRRRTAGEPIQYSQRSKREVLDNDKVERMLAHPTIFVTEQELRQEYSYVLNDLRNMFALAAALVVLLVVLAQII